MTKENLGRLEKVDLRDIWEKEDTHFTPWIAKDENIEKMLVLLEQIFFAKT